MQLPNENVNYFKQYVEWVLLAEGKYSNDKNDRGGVTNYGLSKRFLDDIGWGKAPPSREEAITIYHTYFWKGWMCDQMHPLVAWCACDAYVQHPPKAAALMIQQALGVSMDGIIGAKSLEAAKNPNLLLFWQKYRLARIRYYNDIVKNDASQFDFLDGWHNRVHKLAEGILFSGLVQIEPTKKGLSGALTSSTAKATSLGGLFGVVAGGLAYLGIEPQSALDWLTQVAPSGGLFGVAVAWIAKHNFKDGK